MLVFKKRNSHNVKHEKQGARHHFGKWFRIPIIRSRFIYNSNLHHLHFFSILSFSQHQPQQAKKFSEQKFHWKNPTAKTLSKITDSNIPHLGKTVQSKGPERFASQHWAYTSSQDLALQWKLAMGWTGGGWHFSDLLSGLPNAKLRSYQHSSAFFLGLKIDSFHCCNSLTLHIGYCAY